MAVYKIEFDPQHPFELEIAKNNSGVITLKPLDHKNLENELYEAIDSSDQHLSTRNGTTARRCREHENGNPNNQMDLRGVGQQEAQHVEIVVDTHGDGAVNVYPPGRSGIRRYADVRLPSSITPVPGKAFSAETYQLPPHTFILFTEAGSKPNTLRMRGVVAHRNLGNGYETMPAPSTKMRPLPALPV